MKLVVRLCLSSWLSLGGLCVCSGLPDFFFNFYCYSITVVCLFSSSLYPTLAKPTSLPHLPPWFCPCVLYSSSCNLLFPLSPPHSPLAIVRLFLTSTSLVIFCLLFSSIDYVPVKGEIIWLRILQYILTDKITLSFTDRRFKDLRKIKRKAHIKLIWH